jgi:hypothetical protein
MKPISSNYSRVYRIFCLLMALHLLNLSIDSRDPDPDNFPENLSFNDIESIAEFVTEIVFGWHDAFEEHDETDSEEGGSLDFYKFYCSNQSLTIIRCRPLFLSRFYIRNVVVVLAPVKDILSPPPRA